jgi:hypothetical protein
MRKSALTLAAVLLLPVPAPAQSPVPSSVQSPLRSAAPIPDWSQWGRNAQHTGATTAVGQPARQILADVVYDPFVAAEQASPLAGGDLLAHYQVPILDGTDVFMEFKGGQFTGIDHWETETWSEKRLRWQGRRLITSWTFTSDWKPEPYGLGDLGPTWEPVFHAALAGAFVYVPGAGGTVFKLKRTTGAVVAHISPFGGGIDPDTYVAGPLTVDTAGNVYYTALKLIHGQEWTADVEGSWLVKVAANGKSQAAPFAALTPGAPAGNAACLGSFDNSQLPWPPSPDAVPPSSTCGSQRPAINVAPAVAPDGTIYAVTVAHFSSGTAYLVAANPNLTPKWAASLSGRFTDGCGVLLPPDGTPGGCRAGSTPGVDPSQNRPGSGMVMDNGTASPVVAPDGSVLFGVFTRYNWAQGHLMKFGRDGSYLGAYPFGWDTTPAVRVHNSTYSIVTKENHYSGLGSYCDDDSVCPSDRTANYPASPAAYFITQLSADLTPEWMWRNTNTLSCTHDADGQVTCTSDHPDGFEFCVNAPAVDRNGNVYNNSEDGNLYVVTPQGTLREHLFLDSALGAAYTPVSIGADGKIYTQNNGHLFVVGR